MIFFVSFLKKNICSDVKNFWLSNANWFGWITDHVSNAPFYLKNIIPEFFLLCILHQKDKMKSYETPLNEWKKATKWRKLKLGKPKKSWFICSFLDKTPKKKLHIHFFSSHEVAQKHRTKSYETSINEWKQAKIRKTKKILVHLLIFR